MNTHLSIEVEGKKLTLPSEGFAIDIDMQNPMFNDEDTFSYPIQVPLDGNRHFVQNLEDKRSTLRPVSLENKKARIYTDGFPFFTGKISTSDDEEVTDSISLNVEGENTLADLISDLDCRDIPVKDTIIIGEKISKISVEGKGSLQVQMAVNISGNRSIYFDVKDQTASVEFSPQALGFSVPYQCCSNIADNPTAKKSELTDVDNYVQITPNVVQSYINVSDAYPTKKYCNGKVTYKHYKLKSDGTTDTDNTESNPYFVLDAERPQSGICFYVQYFLDCLFAYLGLEWDNSALTAIEDFNRLCFFTTKCGYDEETKSGTSETSNFDAVNEWLSSRGCGAKFDIEKEKADDIQSISVPTGSDVYIYLGTSYRSYGKLVNGLTFTANTDYTPNPMKMEVSHGEGEIYLINSVNSDIHSKWTSLEVNKVYVEYSRMIANSENFPDESVSTILESLENQFGIRFVYEAEKKKVTARLLRDMYRNQASPRQFLGSVHEMNKLSEKITGVRICYAAESDSKEQQNNLRDSVRDYDTNYDYIDYPNPADKAGSEGTSKASTTILDKTFADFCKTAYNNDNKCYIDKETGNAYRVKIDSEATSGTNMKPAWFEVGQFKGAEFGDCSSANSDNIAEISSSFEPIAMSDTNADRVRSAAGTSVATIQSNQPCLCPFCDEDMEHEYVKQYLDYPIDKIAGSAYVRATLHLKENYDVSRSDDGNSPLQSYDWGLAIAIMRGGGTDAATQIYEANYDGFANSKWRTVVGAYAMTTDSIDHLGNEYDYNTGDQEGIGVGERFSLKPRAYKTPDWIGKEYTVSGVKKVWTVDDLCRADYHNKEGWHYIRTRGWVDRFLFEHANFLLNRRKFIIRCECTAAFLADIPNHWAERWKINGEIGYINKVSTSISVDSGIGESTIEFYAI